MNDDNFGVNEVLNELEFNRGLRVLGKHYLIFGNIYESKASSIITVFFILTLLF